MLRCAAAAAARRGGVAEPSAAGHQMRDRRDAGQRRRPGRLHRCLRGRLPRHRHHLRRGNNVLWDRILYSRNSDEGRGPVFMTAFNPLCMIIVAIMGSIILAEEITLGRYEFLLSHCSASGIESGYTNFSEIDGVVGATIIVIGLYSLIWGTSKDHLTQSSDDDEKKGVFELLISATDAMKSNSAGHGTVAEIPSAKSP
ncbi:uncharacterized protein [Elaeis guineensis]|uniref:uncharacterized protein n=1 Tax=Elaeis guineensis var. tenera TaxID=51953 RepID=UPI003C6D10EF